MLRIFMLAVMQTIRAGVEKVKLQTSEITPLRDHGQDNFFISFFLFP